MTTATEYFIHTYTWQTPEPPTEAPEKAFAVLPLEGSVPTSLDPANIKDLLDTTAEHWRNPSAEDESPLKHSGLTISLTALTGDTFRTLGHQHYPPTQTKETTST